MAKAREPKVFRSMDDLPLMLTPYDLMDFLGKGQRQTYELIHSEGFPYVQDGIWKTYRLILRKWKQT